MCRVTVSFTLRGCKGHILYNKKYYELFYSAAGENFGGIFCLDSDFPLRNSYLNPRRRREEFEYISMAKEYLYE